MSLSQLLTSWYLNNKPVQQVQQLEQLIESGIPEYPSPSPSTSPSPEDERVLCPDCGGHFQPNDLKIHIKKFHSKKSKDVIIKKTTERVPCEFCHNKYLQHRLPIHHKVCKEKLKQELGTSIDDHKFIQQLQKELGKVKIKQKENNEIKKNNDESSSSDEEKSPN